MSYHQPYAKRHANPSGPGDERPTALEVVHDEQAESRYSGKNIMITGGTSGIARDQSKGEEIAKELTTDDSRPVQVIEMRLDSLSSIRNAAESFLTKSKGRLNILITNAGVMAPDFGRTEDGFELQIGINHLGHFFLFQQLAPALVSSSTPDFASRVIALTSNGHRHTEHMNFDDLNVAGGEEAYDKRTAYAQSKLANLYFANEVERRYSSKGVHALAVNPGHAETGLQRHVGDHPMWKQLMQNEDYQKTAKSVEQCAATTVWAAVAKKWEGKGGLYLEDVGEAAPVEEDAPMFGPGFAPWAYNEAAEKRLWEESEKMIAAVAL